MKPGTAKGAAFCLALALLSLSLFSRPANSAEYSYDQEKSSVGFTLRHLGIVTIEGHFKLFSGAFSFDLQNIESSRVNISIQSASVHSGSKLRDEHLRSENFFAAEKHPNILFVSTNFKTIGENRYAVSGNLTIRGITRPAVFEAELLSQSDALSQAGRISFHARTFIHRKDYHLGTGHWFDPIMMVTDESLKISLDIEGIPAFSNK